ncbi:MAG: class I SAM-dependent rRNA methyltransferase [Gemmatimonadota bacterium]|nr:MAG: class I SAM-dependent rRNA methyltransferase [Gemmatimonadota bacterium]
MPSEVVVTARGARRWESGHPWIYRSDVRREPEVQEPGVVTVRSARDRYLGRALYSPASEIRLRLLSRGDEPVDTAWWTARLREAHARRAAIDATAYRVVHAEADSLPSLIVDRYGPHAVVQLLSAGLERCRADVIAAVEEALEPDGILLRNDAPVRQHENLPLEVEVVSGTVPDDVEVEEHSVRYRAALRTGQKTGVFLDQRENRALAGRLGRGRALDIFSYQGAFALHLAQRADSVVAVDSSADALARGRENADLNGLANIEWVEANAFDTLRELERSGERFDLIVLDPPAFAKTKASLGRALAGYKEVNLRAMRILAPGGRLFSFSCSFHVGRALFLEMIAAAAADSGRRLALERTLGQSADHPEIPAIPETGYLKGALLRFDG